MKNKKLLFIIIVIVLIGTFYLFYKENHSVKVQDESGKNIYISENQLKQEELDVEAEIEKFSK